MIVTERERERDRETERERGAETQAVGEAGSMHREPDVGFYPGSPGSCPGPKAGAKLLRHPGIPSFMILLVWVFSLFFLISLANNLSVLLINSFKEPTPDFVDLFPSSSGLYLIEFCSNIYLLSSAG